MTISEAKERVDEVVADEIEDEDRYGMVWQQGYPCLAGSKQMRPGRPVRLTDGRYLDPL
jgi:hypothetical protein